MEYTKDVIFNVNYRNKINTERIIDKIRKSKIVKIVRENKFIVSILSSLAIFIAIDIVLINTFLNLLITI